MQPYDSTRRTLTLGNSYESDKSAHVQDVKSAQDFYQLFDIVFDNDDTTSATTLRAGQWIERNVSKCRANYQNLQKLLRVKPSDFAVVTVFALNNLGTLKIQVLEKIKKELAHLPGVVLVIHPAVPSA